MVSFISLWLVKCTEVIICTVACVHQIVMLVLIWYCVSVNLCKWRQLYHSDEGLLYLIYDTTITCQVHMPSNQGPLSTCAFWKDYSLTCCRRTVIPQAMHLTITILVKYVTWVSINLLSIRCKIVHKNGCGFWKKLQHTPQKKNIYTFQRRDFFFNIFTHL